MLVDKKQDGVVLVVFCTVLAEEYDHLYNRFYSRLIGKFQVLFRMSIIRFLLAIIMNELSCFKNSLLLFFKLSVVFLIVSGIKPFINSSDVRPSIGTLFFPPTRPAQSLTKRPLSQQCQRLSS